MPASISVALANVRTLPLAPTYLRTSVPSSKAASICSEVRANGTQKVFHLSDFIERLMVRFTPLRALNVFEMSLSLKVRAVAVIVERLVL